MEMETEKKKERTRGADFKMTDNRLVSCNVTDCQSKVTEFVKISQKFCFRIEICCSLLRLAVTVSRLLFPLTWKPNGKVSILLTKVVRNVQLLQFHRKAYASILLCVCFFCFTNEFKKKIRNSNKKRKRWEKVDVFLFSVLTDFTDCAYRAPTSIEKRHILIGISKEILCFFRIEFWKSENWLVKLHILQVIQDSKL